ncbi:hypothetical protein D1007_12523 [Hordeum vulgare]|uniref:Predicted protein n=1 Tax=Hordeum vulgare subsp. vulgare TaxID=112509 RepID=F2D4S2_HORVV|nr:hypothetical protein D1007_12523 [Hordeum vulgare]BAJ90093.1 predicted protein [Hordeum vulgare subsp. vulgare]
MQRAGSRSARVATPPWVTSVPLPASTLGVNHCYPRRPSDPLLCAVASHSPPPPRPHARLPQTDPHDTLQPWSCWLPPAPPPPPRPLPAPLDRGHATALRRVTPGRTERPVPNRPTPSRRCAHSPVVPQGPNGGASSLLTRPSPAPLMDSLDPDPLAPPSDESMPTSSIPRPLIQFRWGSRCTTGLPPARSL